jgi:hypothetical protein
MKKVAFIGIATPIVLGILHRGNVQETHKKMKLFTEIA